VDCPHPPKKGNDQRRQFGQQGQGGQGNRQGYKPNYQQGQFRQQNQPALPAPGQFQATYYVDPVQAVAPYQQAVVLMVQHQPGGQMFAAVQRDTGANGALVEGTFLVNDRLARIMFDSGATHSFIVHSFMLELGLRPERLEISLVISTPIGRSIVLDWVCRGVGVHFDGHQFLTDLVVLFMSDFDIILGMDWMSFHRVQLDCYAKTVTF
jgi:hypothetical protein